VEIIQIFLEGFLSLLIFFLTGNVFAVFFPKSKNIPAKVFLKLIGGVLFWIIATAIYATSFKTINILAFFSLLFLWKKEGIPLSKIQLRNLLPSISEVKYFVLCLLVLCLFVGVQFYRNDYFNSNFVYFANPDFSFYLTVAEYLQTTGIERLNPWYELNELSKIQAIEPYHYGDIWLASAMLQWSQIAPLKMFLYVLIPVISTISFTALYAFHNIHSLKSNKFLNIFICYFMLFSVGGIPFFREAFGFTNSPISTPKVFLFFNLCIAGFIFLVRLFLFFQKRKVGNSRFSFSNNNDPWDFYFLLHFWKI